MGSSRELILRNGSTWSFWICEIEAAACRVDEFVGNVLGISDWLCDSDRGGAGGRYVV